MIKIKSISVILVVMTAFSLAYGQEKSSDSTGSRIPANSKIFVNPMEDGFETYIVAALQKRRYRFRS